VDAYVDAEKGATGMTGVPRGMRIGKRLQEHAMARVGARQEHIRRHLLPNLDVPATSSVRPLLALRPVVLPTIERATTPMRTDASAVYVPERWEELLMEINKEVRAATGQFGAARPRHPSVGLG
jgi:hypothetical protein